MHIWKRRPPWGRSTLSRHDETRDRELLLDEIQVRILKDRDEGKEPSQEEVISSYPEFEKEIREIFENERLAESILGSDTPLPGFGDDYEVLKEIGRGGMGIVYKAYQKSLKRIVAVRTIIGGRQAAEADINRFRQEAQAAAKLQHPNIITIHEVGEHQGEHFFSMEYVEGRSLTDLVHNASISPTQAADFLKPVAEAIHYAHQRRILHGDLKPGNVLLDKQDKPYITDFGLAKRLGEDTRQSGAVEGTASYMAPEQAAGEEELTTASDVYGLGAILYSLLTAKPPFRGETLQETLRLVREKIPKPPRALNPSVDSDLEAVCLKCLSKDKDDRYGSADALAEDLAHYLTREETTARPWSRRERFTRWCQRNPAVTSLVGAIAVISMLAVTMALFVANARKEAQLEAALQSNSFAATDLATTALLQLRSLSRPVETAAADPRLAVLLANDDRNGLEQILSDICSGSAIPFMTCYTMNRDGIMVAHAPLANTIGQDFSWRDHFQGAKKQGVAGHSRPVHISRVYLGRSDNLYKFAISAPILDREKNFLGVIATSVTTDATMGLVHVTDPRRVWALIAPKDIDSAELDPQSHIGEYVVLIHPAYQRGVPAVEFPEGSMVAARLERDHAKELDLPDSRLILPPNRDYRDPVASADQDYEGRWIAGFAPVGNTGFVVIVQQRFEDVVGLDSSVLWNLAFWSVLISFLAIAIVGLVLWRWAHSQRRQPSFRNEPGLS